MEHSRGAAQVLRSQHAWHCPASTASGQYVALPLHPPLEGPAVQA